MQANQTIQALLTYLESLEIVRKVRKSNESSKVKDNTFKCPSTDGKVYYRYPQHSVTFKLNIDSIKSANNAGELLSSGVVDTVIIAEQKTLRSLSESAIVQAATDGVEVNLENTLTKTRGKAKDPVAAFTKLSSGMTVDQKRESARIAMESIGMSAEQIETALAEVK